MVYESLSSLAWVVCMGIMFTVFLYSIWLWIKNFKTAERFWRAFRQCHDLAERIIRYSPPNWMHENANAIQLQHDLESLTYFRDKSKRIKLCRIFLDKWEARIADRDLFETFQENQEYEQDKTEQGRRQQAEHGRQA